MTRRDGRAVEGATLEMWCGETHRGFESHSLRHFYAQITAFFPITSPFFLPDAILRHNVSKQAGYRDSEKQSDKNETSGTTSRKTSGKRKERPLLSTSS